MNSKSIISTTKNLELSPKEYAVVRSYILGLSDETLMQFLQIDRFDLAQVWNKLYKKFNQSNPYVLIRRIIQLGLIEVGNYLPETVKSSTLDFINLHQDQFPFKCPKSEAEKWAYFRKLLFKFKK